VVAVTTDKAVCIMSGGLDSTVSAFLAKRAGYEIYGLTFNYQRNKEIEMLNLLCQWEHIPLVVMPLDMSMLKAPTPKEGLDSGKAIGDASFTYSPARNTIFLSLGARYAEAIGAKIVVSGIQYESGYPDTSRTFVESMNHTLLVGTASKIQLWTPLIDDDKARIIEKGKSVGVPFELTWSCYDDGDVPCMTCDSCLIRARGFYQNNMVDPIYTKDQWAKQIKELEVRRMI